MLVEVVGRLAHKKMKKAYTLVEILAAMAIFGIILSMALVAFRSYNKKRNLELSTQEIKTALEDALTMSMGPRDSGGVSGYGVCFNKPGTVWNYAIHKNDCGTVAIGKEESIRSGVDVSWMTIDKNGATSSSSSADFSVFFGVPQNVGTGSSSDVVTDTTSISPSLPYARTILWNGGGLDTYQTGLINLAANTYTRKIKVNLVTGSINVE